jgi:hypothetical protein
MKPCERMIVHRAATTHAASGAAEAVPWCKTHQQEMLSGLRCATGFDEEIADLRTVITEIKLHLNRRMAR